MTELSRLHRGLRRLRRLSRVARVGSAASMFVSPLLWALLAAALLDVTMNMGRLERAVTLLLVAGVGAWAFRRFIRPAFDFSESELETAMLVEGCNGISTDLVAAMQFAETGRAQYGSEELRRAAVERAVRLAPTLNYLRGFSGRESERCLGIFAVSALVFVAPMILYPAHGKAFMERWVYFAGTHYPTKTLIRTIESPGERAPFGRPLAFRVRAGGELPGKGMVSLRSLATGLRAEIELLPAEDEPGLYVGGLPRLLDDVSYQVFLGDAYTDPCTVAIIPLPVVEVDFNVSTPEYASARFAEAAERYPGRLALQGSRVVPIVTADKQLESVTFTLNGQHYPLQREGERFVLKEKDTPLAAVAATVRWEAQVVDSDGLSLERPVSGVLQVRPDQAPNVGFAAATRLVWPGASPSVHYKAVDDYALDRVEARLSVRRLTPEGAGETPTNTLETVIHVASATNHEVEIQGSLDLPMKDLAVVKGDRILISFEAFDYRGALPPQSMSGPPLVLEVSDREGVIDALHKLDEQIDKKLDQIIDAQLGM